MRDIRFRAWVKRLNRYVDTCFIYNDGSWAYEYEHFTEELGGHIVGGSPCEDDIIEQFTGLYDKNNNPIYEGDIVKYKSSSESGTALIAKMYTSNNLGFEWKEQKTPRPSIIDSVHYYGCKEELEIIGNINENQELIKQ